MRLPAPPIERRVVVVDALVEEEHRQSRLLLDDLKRRRLVGQRARFIEEPFPVQVDEDRVRGGVLGHLRPAIRRRCCGRGRHGVAIERREVRAGSSARGKRRQQPIAHAVGVRASAASCRPSGRSSAPSAQGCPGKPPVARTSRGRRDRRSLAAGQRPKPRTGDPPVGPQVHAVQRG